MKSETSIGEMIKTYMKYRNTTIKAAAQTLGIKYSTFCAQLNNNTLTAETLFRLADLLDMDLNWMLVVLGYRGYVSRIDRELLPRMTADFREHQRKALEGSLQNALQRNPTSIPDARRELVENFGMFYLLDVLVPEEDKLYRICEQGTFHYYADIPKDPETVRGSPLKSHGRRKSTNELCPGAKVLDNILRERKSQL